MRYASLAVVFVNIRSTNRLQIYTLFSKQPKKSEPTPPHTHKPAQRRDKKNLAVGTVPQQPDNDVECISVALLRAHQLFLNKPDGAAAATDVVIHAHPARKEAEEPRET